MQALARLQTGTRGNSTNDGTQPRAIGGCKKAVPRCYNCEKVGHTKVEGRNDMRCYNCGKEEHQAADCPAPLKCTYCKGGHHKNECLDRVSSQERITRSPLDMTRLLTTSWNFVRSTRGSCSICRFRLRCRTESSQPHRTVVLANVRMSARTTVRNQGSRCPESPILSVAALVEK